MKKVIIPTVCLLVAAGVAGYFWLYTNNKPQETNIRPQENTAFLEKQAPPIAAPPQTTSKPTQMNAPASAPVKSEVLSVDRFAFVAQCTPFAPSFFSSFDYIGIIPTSEFAHATVTGKTLPVKSWTTDELRKLSDEELRNSLYEALVVLKFNAIIDAVRNSKSQNPLDWLKASWQALENQEKFTASSQVIIDEVAKRIYNTDRGNAVSIKRVSKEQFFIDADKKSSNVIGVVIRYYANGIMLKHYVAFVKQEKENNNKPVGEFDFLAFNPLQLFDGGGDARIVILDYDPSLEIEADDVASFINYCGWLTGIDLDLSEMKRLADTFHKLVTQGGVPKKNFFRLAEKAANRCAVYADMEPQNAEQWKMISAKFRNIAILWQ